MIELRSWDEPDAFAVGHARAARAAALACTINLPEVFPGEHPPSPWAAVFETWVDSLDSYRDILDAERRARQSGPVAAYHVAEHIAKDEPPRPVPGQRTPGVKAIYFVRRRPALSDHEASTLWRDHADVAREHHTGMSRYVQNAVIAALVPGSPVFHGIAVLHFPSLEDLSERMYSSSAGEAAIRSDATRLVEEAVFLPCSELVLKVRP